MVRFQKQLQSMKFHDGEITGIMDEAMRLAVKAWADYRSEDREAYSFYRTVITENLLDALGVLEDEGDLSKAR